MKKVISEVVGFAVPAATFLCSMGKSGYQGAPAFTSTLKRFGGGDMLMGLCALWGFSFCTRKLTESIISGIQLMKADESFEQKFCVSPTENIQKLSSDQQPLGSCETPQETLAPV